ncbi:MAG TPA: hypothetical protein DEG96_07360 [Candidatus Atribacteria bacterium]|nr:hypothetical protein [Candidatus Atribacteria bacterium]
MKKQLEILLELQRIDNDIDEEEKKKRELPLKLNKIAGEIQELQNNLVAAKKAYKELQINLNRKELDLSDKSNKIKKHQEDLYGGKITDIKELKQLQGAIANYEEEKALIEDELLDLMEKVEENDKLIMELEEDLKKKERHLQDCQQEIKLTVSKIDEKINSFYDRRKGILSKITDNHLLKEYELLRKEKDGKAIIEVNSSICPGCYLDLPSDTIYHLKKEQIVTTCPNCNRILVWKG